MGGRGSASKLRASKIPVPQQPAVAQQVPNATNTAVNANALDTLSQMSDAQLAQVFRDSQKANMPNHLDDVSDITQRFVYYNGLNEMPQVLDTAAFNQFMANNNIPQSDILSRSINGGTLRSSSGNSRNLTAQDVADMMMYSRMNYVGGKHGGQAYGAGTYFDMNGGGATGYGGSNSKTVMAVLNPKTAKIIDSHTLAAKARAFDQSHPAFRKATGGFSTSFYNNNMSVYALVMGYNVIRSGSYHNVISRDALVYKK